MDSTAARSSSALEQERTRLAERYAQIRHESQRLCEPLETEDYVIQTMPDVSPPKWHLAHTSWFFETFLLDRFAPAHTSFDPAFDHLFNSYYLTHGRPFPRPQRGLLSRPTVREVLRYRAAVDEQMLQLVDDLPQQRWLGFAELVELGLNHEQQHQELLLTDIKHILGSNPLRPVYRPRPKSPAGSVPALGWVEQGESLHEIGHQGTGFAFDNEGPRHRVFVEAYLLASRLTTNAEYLEFMQDGGYGAPALWLSDGWATVQSAGWQAPLYWERRGDQWWQYSLAGLRPVEPAEPVTHVSFYEADAFARWAGRRLPTEVEWEVAAGGISVEGNLRDRGHLHPVALAPDSIAPAQLFGDVWEWTASPYSPYPGYRPPSGTIGEYNGKFMSSQMVLRGGSCVTPRDHVRATYRNFFYPKDRWQFSGIRLAGNR